ncbi:hypothetical protein [Spiroplasma endosymbiont of Virgichneumon dumeticola]|uniref:hypothetical protein n=1 Tax=Spiroplasma endosymbiont of Virgichneumon dumeticola TaxID=3139323 RepID=UPI0035C93992
MLDFNNIDTPYKNGISSPILLALENNDSEMIILLLELNVTIHFENKNIEENPLAIAIKQANPLILNILLFTNH